MAKNGIALTLPAQSPDGDGNNLRPGDMQEEDYQGIPLCITHRPGNSYTAPGDFAAWLPADVSYGYIEGSEGPNDEDKGIPVLVRLDNPSDKAFTVALTAPDGTFWGHIVLLGFDDPEAAMEFCKMTWGDAPTKGTLTEMTLEDLDDWVQDTALKAEREDREDPDEEDEDEDDEDEPDPDDPDYDEAEDPAEDHYEVLDPSDLEDEEED